MEARIVVRVDDALLAAFVDEFYDGLASEGDYHGPRPSPKEFVLERLREEAANLRAACAAWADATAFEIEVEDVDA